MARNSWRLDSVSGFEDLLLSAGYVRDEKTLGAIDAERRPSAEEVETFCGDLADQLEVDPEAMILEFAPVEGPRGAARVHVIVWWDGDLSRAERFGLASAFRDRFVEPRGTLAQE